MSFQDADDLKVVCGNCGQKVRIPAGFTRRRFRCPACHQRIRTSKGKGLQSMMGVILIGSVVVIAAAAAYFIWA